MKKKRNIPMIIAWVLLTLSIAAIAIMYVSENCSEIGSLPGMGCMGTALTFAYFSGPVFILSCIIALISSIKKIYKKLSLGSELYFFGFLFLMILFPISFLLSIDEILILIVVCLITFLMSYIKKFL